MVDRAARLARELDLTSSIVSSGQEWRRPDLARSAGATFITPLNYPSLPKLPSAARSAVSERAVPAVRTGGRVLVVEDDDEIRTLVLETLRESGHEVLGARDGRDGIEIADREKPDLIIVDKLMPEMDGTEFTREYRARAGTAPIVAFCASRDAVEWATSIGAAAYVTKPFDLEELDRVVDRELARVGAGDPKRGPA